MNAVSVTTPFITALTVTTAIVGTTVITTAIVTYVRPRISAYAIIGTP
jgi:hypothetical protein